MEVCIRFLSVNELTLLNNEYIGSGTGQVV